MTGLHAGRHGFRKAMFFGKSMSRTRCSLGLMDALQRHGIEVRWVNMAKLRRWRGRAGAAKRAREIYRNFRPDLVVGFYMDLPADMMAEWRRDVPILIWCEEALETLTPATLKEGGDPVPSFVPYFAGADLISLSNGAKIPLLEAHGIPRHRLTFEFTGFSPRYHSPAPRKGYQRDVAFMGGPGRQGQRVPLMLRLAERFQCDVFGNGWDAYPQAVEKLRIRKPVKPRGFARVAASSRVILGTNEINNDWLHWSNRTWLCLGVGAFHLTHYVPGMEEVFGRGVHLDWFEGADEAVEKVAEWVPKDREREAVADAGHALVMEKHQYFHRVASLLGQLDAMRDRFHCAQKPAAAGPEPS